MVRVTRLDRFLVKTTLNPDDQILRRAKGRAARDGVTLTRFVENVLHAQLAPRHKRPGFNLELINDRDFERFDGLHVRYLGETSSPSTGS